MKRVLSIILLKSVFTKLSIDSFKGIKSLDKASVLAVIISDITIH